MERRFWILASSTDWAIGQRLGATQLCALLLGSLYSPWHQLILDFRQDLRDAARSFRNRAAIATNHRSA